ncbi:hypothetical protein C9374_004735 [Naegleria lovaniensis]|uniref:Protein kinase domain-containing protein n=1 Tax=Naegleria lovaniensis TaxID=51637 RepID=A0AA88GRE1_NAELO|nr:uncharacterized protein C9374_004735 [Naegleria lovaniensis]KAG2382768.1 hypothetical protein C9374_004735 [Naegleria lovaniensis]
MPSAWKTMIIGSSSNKSSNMNHTNNNNNNNNNGNGRDPTRSSSPTPIRSSSRGRGRSGSSKDDEPPLQHERSPQVNRANTLILNTEASATRREENEEQWYEQHHHHHTSKKFGFLDRFTMLGNSPSSKDHKRSQSPRATMIKGRTLNLDHEDFESFNITAPFDAETLIMKRGSSLAHSENRGRSEFTAVVTTVSKTQKSIPSELLLALERFRVRKHGELPTAEEPTFSDFIRNIQEREDLTNTDKLEILMKQLSQHYVALEYHHNYQQHKFKSTTTNHHSHEFKSFKNKEISNYCSALGISLAENSQLMINNSLFHTLKQAYEAVNENDNPKSGSAADWSMYVASLVDALKLYLPNAKKLTTFGLLSSIKQLVTTCIDESSTDGDISLSYHSLINNLLSMAPDTKYSTNVSMEIKIEDVSNQFPIQIDGCAQRYDKKYLIAELRENDFEDDWEKYDIDMFKLLLCMKSSLIENLENSKLDIKDIANKSKVSGLIASRTAIHLFILEACFDKDPILKNFSPLDIELEDVTLMKDPKCTLTHFKLHHRQFCPLDEESLLSFISLFSRHVFLYAPKKSSKRSNALAISNASIHYQTNSMKHHIVSDTFSNVNVNILCGRKVLQIHEETSHNTPLYTVTSTSLMKHVSPNELYIIQLLLSRSDYSKHLPHVLSLHKNYVEFEKLEPIADDLLWDETSIFMLILDVASALRLLDVRENNYLNNIVESSATTINGHDSNNERSSLWFRAPEMLDEENSSHYSEKVDIYALGASVLSIIEKSSWSKKHHKTTTGVGLSSDFGSPSNSSHLKKKLEFSTTTNQATIGSTGIASSHNSTNSHDEDGNVVNLGSSLYWNEIMSSLSSSCLSTPVRTILQLMLDQNPNKRPSALEVEKTVRVHLVHKIEPRRRERTLSVLRRP